MAVLIDDHLRNLYYDCCDFNIGTFNYADYSNYDFEKDIYVDNNVFHSKRLPLRYYTDFQFTNRRHVNKGFSILHINFRKLSANCLNGFDFYWAVIAVSETRLFSTSNPALYSLPRYDVYHKDRTSKTGRGYAWLYM